MADDNNGSFVEVMETFQNIGPILDMSVVDLDKQGQDLVRLSVCLCVCIFRCVHMLSVHVVFCLCTLSCMCSHISSPSLPLPLYLPLSLSLSHPPSGLSLAQAMVKMVPFELFVVALASMKQPPLT